MKFDAEGGSSQEKPRTGERRSSGRIVARRDVVFSDYQATGPLRAGMTVDMSARGFRIRTAYPEALGSEIQIELQPEPQGVSGVVLFRGRVMHVTRTDGGEHLMGVRITRSRPLEPAVLYSGRKTEAATPLKSYSEPHRRFALAKKAKESRAPRQVRFRKVRAPASKSRRRPIWGSLFGLFLLVLLLAHEALDGDHEGFFRSANGAMLNGEPVPEPERMGSGPSSVLRSELNRSRGLERVARAEMPRWRDARTVDALLLSAQAALRNGDLDRAESMFADLSRDSRADAIQRFVSSYGYAEAAAARGDSRLGRVVLRRALQLGDTVPEVWRGAGEELYAQLGNARGARRAWDTMTSEVTVAAQMQDETSSNPYRIEVSASEYLLKVLRGDEVVGSFPVGLGIDGATPRGGFEIANKISDPDWYNRGEIVAAGDSRNPLGSSWMGLGGQSAPVGIGIHPTTDEASIGQPQSRGCIRMRPRDAEALFRLVPIGTPVRIRS